MFNSRFDKNLFVIETIHNQSNGLEKKLLIKIGKIDWSLYI